MASDPAKTWIRDADRAIIRPASFGIRNGRGYLLYWGVGGAELVDSWTTYKSRAQAAQAAQQQRSGIRVVNDDR